MKITALKQQLRDNNRVNVFVDDSYSFSLTLDQIITEKIKVDLELSNEQVESLRKKSSDHKLRLKVIEWLTLRARSTKELEDYLKKRNIEHEHAHTLIDEMQDKKYISDESFAEWYVDYKIRKLKSSLEITQALRQKGIAEEIISDVLYKYKENETQNLQKLIAKYRIKYRDDKKLISYLMRRGYSFSEVKEALIEG